jgi:hypothetical protein
MSWRPNVIAELDDPARQAAADVIAQAWLDRANSAK